MSALKSWPLALLLTGCTAGTPTPPTATSNFHELANWPWKDEEVSHPSRGVTRWFVPTSSDGTSAELLRFDFEENPRLKFAIYDRDQDDEHPFDDRANYRENGVAQAARHLESTTGRPVVAAWNGLFFGYDPKDRSVGRHIGAVVLGSKVHFNFGNWRWTFGAKLVEGKPHFKVIHMPDRQTLEREFDFAAVGAQCLIRDGRPLKLRPSPADGDPPLKQPVPCAGDEAGCIPIVDFMRTSRTSMGWSKDNRYLYVLIVNEPDSELESKIAYKHGQPLGSGWTLADLQHFWSTFGVWGAVNSDGGAETQLLYRLSDGRFSLLPSRLASPNHRLVLSKQLENAPKGGSLMTYYVYEE